MRSNKALIYAPNGARLDDTDLAILRRLHEDSRVPNAQLAQAIDLSPSATMQRVRRLEEVGAIHRYAAEADETIFEAWSTLLVTIELRRAAKARRVEFELLVAECPEVIEAIELTGPRDYLLKAALPNAAAWSILRTRLDPEAQFIKRAELIPIVRTAKLRGPHPLLVSAQG